MRSLLVAFVALASSLSVGCVTAQGTSMPGNFPAKSDDCSVEIVDKLPEGDLAMIGIVDLYAATGKISIGVDELKKKLKTPVCRLGGDLAVYDPARTEKVFERAIVYRRGTTTN